MWLSVGAVACALTMALPSAVSAAGTTGVGRTARTAKIAKAAETAEALRDPVLRHGPRAVADQKRVRLVVRHRTVLRETPRALRIRRADPEATVVAGQNGIYTLSVTNNGPAVATNVVVTDTLDSRLEVVTPLPAGCTAVGQVVTCTLASLGVGATQNWDITVRVRPNVPTGTVIPNVSSVDSDTSTPEDSNNANINVETSSDLAIGKTAGTLNAGGSGTYTITVTNNGPSDDTGVVVTDTLPTGLTFVSSVPAGCTAVGQVVTCPVGALAAGASTNIVLNVAVSAGTAGTVNNTATVTGVNPDPDPNNNTVTITTPINAVSDLTITKSVRAE
ncbi:DUF11 domain-containing protein [Streptosporangium saharense]|uniref:DUF11 domain-containing protein n=1 Tax=Streptosporangium saharense TaxID=1706840 RepID=UPI00332BE3C2